MMHTRTGVFWDSAQTCALIFIWNFFRSQTLSIAVAKELRVVILNCSLCRGKMHAEEQQQPLAESTHSGSYVQFTRPWPSFWAWALFIYLGAAPGGWYKYTARQRFPRLPKKFAFQTLIHLRV